MPHKEELALCFVTMLWGATFLVIRLAMEQCGPLFFVGLRFAAAAFALFLTALPVLKGMTRREVFAGILLGVIVFAGFALQTAGLISVEAARSAFLTAFYVPLVPAMEWLLLRRPPSGRGLAGLALAFGGVFLLSGGADLSFSLTGGEGLTLLCALLFALEIVCTGIAAPGCSARRLALVEVTVTSLLAFALMPLTGEAPPAFSWFPVLAALGTGAATALIQGIVVWAQKTVPPVRATIIYTGEPVWGGVFGCLAGERLTASALAGCGLVLAGILTGALNRKKPGGS